VQAGKLSAKDMEECLTAADILRGNLLSFQYQLPQVHKVVELAAAVLEVFESKPSIALMVRHLGTIAAWRQSSYLHLGEACVSRAP
jgi:hypothetical protein